MNAAIALTLEGGRSWCMKCMHIIEKVLISLVLSIK